MNAKEARILMKKQIEQEAFNLLRTAIPYTSKKIKKQASEGKNVYVFCLDNTKDSYLRVIKLLYHYYKRRGYRVSIGDIYYERFLYIRW